MAWKDRSVKRIARILRRSMVMDVQSLPYGWVKLPSFISI
jgi:hypothetical protein